MDSRPDLVTEIQEDWPLENLLALQTVLHTAYGKSGELTNPVTDAVFSTPNRTILVGFVRWFVVDSLLHRACEVGALKEITAKWIPLSAGSGGVMALELRGKKTTLIAHHLQNADDPPRDSVLRFTKRVMNYRFQSLPGFDADGDEDEGLINLTLVHGDKAANFAYLRMYDDPDNLRSHVQVSENLMTLPTLVVPVEGEDIPAPSVDLKPGVGKKDKTAEGK